jgi:hypothetical protein
VFISEAPIVAIFNPIDVQGPAHQGNQTLQKLAQGAAQNVLRRQKMRALLAQGARGAASAVGGSTPFRSSMNAHPTGVRGLPRPQGLAALLGGAGAHAGGPSDARDGGMLGAGGGGYDYPSLPDPNDASQAPAAGPSPAAPAGAADAVGAPPLNGATAQFNAGVGNIGSTPTIEEPPLNGATAQFNAGIGNIGSNMAPAPTSSGSAGSDNGLIHLGNGLYYDPVTDAVHGAPSR